MLLTAPTERRTRPAVGWIVELVCASAALALAIACLAHLADSDRSALLFTDGDSLVQVLQQRSLSVGQPQDWVLSSVLFLPESALYLGLATLGGPVAVTLVANGIVNLLALYAVIRFAARDRARPVRAALASLCAFAVFCALLLTESSGDRNSLELASLLTTTTYYSASAIATVATVALLSRALVAATGPRLIAVTVVTAVSVASNPIHLAWAVAPGMLLVATFAAAGSVPWRRAAGPLGALAAGAAAGLLARIPLSALTATSGAEHLQPQAWPTSLRYYAGLLAERAATPEGMLAIAIVVVLLAATAWASIRRRHEPYAPDDLLLAAAWFVPACVLIVVVGMGTEAARYLQPVVLLAVLGVVPLTRIAARAPVAAALSGRRRAATAVLAAAALAAAGGLTIVVKGGDLTSDASAPTASRLQRDLRCVTDWVDASGAVGAGQFWTIRAPKSSVRDPRTLVQVTNDLRPYPWLVNRDDFANARVSFLVTDAQSAPFVLPAGIGVTRDVHCGSYTIEELSFPVALH